MQYNPHKFQQYAADFIINNPVSAVFLDMGLGKTAITLTALMQLLFDRFEAHRVLVIAPLRVARDVWPEEIRKWEHLSDLRFSVAIGTEAERLAALEAEADIYLINRENVQWLIEKSKIPFEFDTVVIDELSSFKSHKAKRFKALLNVRSRIKRIIGLTGTPTSNGLMDLYAEYRLLDMGKRLGRFIGQYRSAYFEPDRHNGQIVYSYKLLPNAEKRIYNKISDITVSMKATDHLTMPELLSVGYSVLLSVDEQEVYDELKRELVLTLQNDEVTAANAAVLSGKLCQMANGAVYGDDESVVYIHDQKLDALEDLIESAYGKPVLVAYWFKHDLMRIKERLNSLGIVYAKLDSPESIKQWNRGELPVGLIHPASAGHGLNLQSGGNTLVWFGLTWSLELYQQTNARLWRQGQSAETVVIHHIITKDTIDAYVLDALSAKDKTQQSLIKAVKANL